MEFAIIRPDDQFRDTRPFEANLIRLNHLSFYLYTFEPWQCLPMHRHPKNDTLLYAVEGDGIIYVDGEARTLNKDNAVGIPADTPYAILAREHNLTVISVNGPMPVETVKMDAFSYDCPSCEMKTPVTTNVEEGCLTKCPRCHATVEIKKGEGRYDARLSDEPAPAPIYIE